MAQKDVNIQKLAPRNFEDIVDYLGGFGKYQFYVLVILGSFDFPTNLIGMLSTFSGAKPEFWTCDGIRLPPNATCTCNGTLAAPLPFTSMVAEWSLVCDKSWVADTITSVQMFGSLPSIIFASMVSDWYGRRIALQGTAMIFTIGAIMSALAPNIYVFTIGRFLVGAGSGGSQATIAVYIIEFMPRSWRANSSSLRPTGLGLILLGVMAYFFRPWRSLAWATTTSIVIAASVIWLVPESPRWLMRNRKITEAHLILCRIARMNNRPPLNEYVIREIADKEMSSKDSAVKNSYLSILKDPSLRKPAICLISIFFFWDIIGSGLTLNIKNMPGNPFLNLIYVGISETLGNISAILIANRLGRRGSMILAISFATLCLISMAGLRLTFGANFYPELMLGIYILAKFNLSVGRAVIRCLSPETFPTPVRSMGNGLCRIAASLGLIICPQLVYLGSDDPAIPLFAFAVIGVVICILGFCMSETEGKPMQDKLNKDLNSTF